MTFNKFYKIKKIRTLILLLLLLQDSPIHAQQLSFFDFLFRKIAPSQIEYHLNQKHIFLIKPLAIIGQNYIADCINEKNQTIRLTINVYNEHIERTEHISFAQHKNKTRTSSLLHYNKNLLLNRHIQAIKDKPDIQTLYHQSKPLIIDPQSNDKENQSNSAAKKFQGQNTAPIPKMKSTIPAKTQENPASKIGKTLSFD